MIAAVTCTVLLLTACENTTTPTTTRPPLAPPDGGVMLVPTTDVPTPPSTDPLPLVYNGFLANGAHYVARVPGERPEFAGSVSGNFSYMSENGLIPVGEVRYRRARPSSFEMGYDPGLLRLQSENWLVEVEFDPLVLADLGENAEEAATRSIILEVLEDTPILRLASPFTWVDGVAQVSYETFVVASGCWDMAVQCSDNRSVQLLSAPEVFVQTRGLTQDQIDNLSIESSTGRAVSDRNYLYPGPLEQRLSADLIWTGEEMIVWGGRKTRDGLNTLVDGAAFDPVTGGWSLLPRFPIDGPQATRAVWGEGEMIVVSPDGTFGYDPDSDSWREIGLGVVPSEWSDRMIYIDGKVYVWARVSLISELNVATGQWRTVDAPTESGPYVDPWSGVLRGIGDRLIAVTRRASNCTGKRFWQFLDNGWEEFQDVSLATGESADCSFPNQAAAVAGSLVIWAEESHPSAAYSFESGEWRDIPSIPLGGSEGPSGPVPMDSDHFMVPQWGEAAVFDATTETWTQVTLPGTGTDAEIIWTGTEFLAWGIWETFDAWSWTPDFDG